MVTQENQEGRGKTEQAAMARTVQWVKNSHTHINNRVIGKVQQSQDRFQKYQNQLKRKSYHKDL